MKFGSIVRVADGDFAPFFGEAIGIVLDIRNGVATVRFTLSFGPHLIEYDKQIVTSVLEVLKVDEGANIPPEATEASEEG